MNDEKFEALLIDSMPDIPPENIVKHITPWKTFVYYILIGLILNTITFSFWNLQYILPLIGNFFMLFGFRVLKKENRWFYYGFVFSWICLLTTLPGFILNATLYRTLYTSINMIQFFLLVIGIAKLFCFYGLYRCLVFGFREIQEKCGMKPQLFTGNLVLGWCLVICLLGIIHDENPVTTFILIVAYFFIVFGFYKLAKELEHIGYSILLSPVRNSGKKIVLGTLSILFIGCIIGYTFFDSYPMNWTEHSISQEKEIIQIKENLIEQGFPEDVLEDLTEEDILECKNARRVITDITTYKNDKNIPKENIGYGIAVELGDKPNHFKIIHYFKWTDHAKFYGTEAVTLWTVSNGNISYWKTNKDYSGQLLYDYNGITWQSPYYSLKQINAEHPDWTILGEKTEIWGEFSFPNDGANYRGYVSYNAILAENHGGILNSWLNYTHQIKPFLYPVTAAIDHWANGISLDGNFDLYQYAFQYDLKENKSFSDMNDE